jgi:YbgC/YbaW family acyl-CoA thioester hydrolase
MFILKQRVNFYDCDPAGIIFYSRIFDFCHSAYEQMISSFRIKENYWNNKLYVVPIVHSECKYLKPIKFDDEIKISVKVSQIKDSSFELNYSIKKNNKLCCEVKTIHVSVDKKNWKKKRLSKQLLQGLEKHKA